VIGTILAHDSDTGDFGEVTYLMDRRSSKVRIYIIIIEKHERLSNHVYNNFKRAASQWILRQVLYW